MLDNVFNAAGSPKYKYYYSEADAIVTGMNAALGFLAQGKRTEL